MTITHPEDMHPRVATLMELIRGVLNLSRIADPNHTRDNHHHAEISAVPCISDNVDVLFHKDLIQAVFKQAGIH